MAAPFSRESALEVFLSQLVSGNTPIQILASFESPIMRNRHQASN